MNCKHPIKFIKEGEEHSYLPDGWGGTAENADYWLECSKCKKRVEIYAQYHGGHNGLYSKHYHELTGRRLDLEEMKKVFKYNNILFHNFMDLNSDLVDLVMKKPSVDRKLKKLNSTIETLAVELKKLEKQRDSLWDQKRRP